MAAELLDFNSTYYKQTSGTDGINDWMEVNCSPPTEVFRVTSNETGDWFFCRKIEKVKSVLIQNHGGSFATGADVAPPKVTVTHASAGGTAKIAIGHTTSREEFSVIIIGEL